MKTLRSLFALTLMVAGIATLFTACGDDDPEETISPVSLVLRQQSIAEGAEVDATLTTALTLTYSTSVRIADAGGITLNGSAVTAQSNGLDVSIPLQLQPGASYTVRVAEGAIISTLDAKVKAPAFALTFTTRSASQPVDNSPEALPKRLGWGWNLGNHFDTSSGEDGKHPQWGYWDNATPTQQLYANLKKAGASTVRIGVTWGNYQSGDAYTIEPAYMAEVRQNVEWAGQAGLNVILNMHHDEYWLDIKTAATNSATNTAIKDRITKTWTQIAETFKSMGDFLFFETFNEIQDGGWGWGDNRTDGGKQYRTLNEWNQTAVDAIRATGGNNATRWIGVPGYAASPSFVLIDQFQLPTDAAQRLMVSVHFYDPSNYTLSPYKDDDNSTYKKGGYSEWGHTAAAGKADTGSNEAHVVDVFKRLQQKFIAKGIPVYIGEYGCVQHTNNRSNLFRRYYLEYVCRAAHTYGMPLCIWDNNATGGGNEHHGYFNHSDGTFLNASAQLVQTMVNAATSDDASYTLETIYQQAPQ